MLDNMTIDNKEPYRFKINKLKTKNEAEIILEKINVFVGANNCGKTQILKDIYNHIMGEDVQNILLQDIDIKYPINFSEMEEVYNFEYDTSKISQKSIRHVSPTFTSDNVERPVYQFEETIEKFLKKDLKSFRHIVGPGMLTYLKTDNRLLMAMSSEIKKRLSGRAPQNVLEVLYKAGTTKTNKVIEYVKQIFNIEIFFDSTEPGVLQYKVDKDFSHISSNAQEAYNQLSSVPILDSQGDGLRSAVSIITALLAVKKPIILLDEPEAFLHPPQAMQLGKIISELVDDSQQIFISTHSVDFLKGLLMSNDEIQVMHMKRSENNDMKADVLDKDVLNQINKDPLLSSARVLDGMFYKGIVATEGDADATFYQRAFLKMGSSNDIHFINAHNKQTLKKVIKPYQKLGVKFAVIVDADIIRDRNEFLDLIEFIDKKDIKTDLTNYRNSLYEALRKESPYSRLEKIYTEIEELSRRVLLDINATEEDIETELKEYKRKFNELKANSDELDGLKKNGINTFEENMQKVFVEFIKKCASEGVFVVKVGELESWLKDYGLETSSNKARWIENALETLNNIEELDGTKEIWKFMSELKMFFEL